MPSQARIAKYKDIISIISGEHNGCTARALEDAEGKITFRVRLLDGPNHGLKVQIKRGDYVVGG